MIDFKLLLNTTDPISRVRLQVNSKVNVKIIAKHETILQHMVFVDDMIACLQGVRIHGVIRRNYRNSFDIFCEAAGEELDAFCNELVASDSKHAPNYCVIMPNDEGNQP